MFKQTKKFENKQIDNLLKILEIKNPVKNDAAVFFDIDGTVSRNDNLELLITEITRRDLLPSNTEEVVEKTRKLWKSRELDFNDYLKTVIEIIPHLKNFSCDILKKIAQDIIDGEGSHYYLFPWMLLLRLKALGYKLIAISGAPEFMAEIFLNKIGIFPWKIHASKYIFENSVFTGGIDLSILKNKGEFIGKKYKDAFDFKKCIALGDTFEDVSMLKKVGKKIIINPTYKLAEEAKKNKWPVVLERKDLIVIFPKGELNI